MATSLSFVPLTLLLLPIEIRDRIYHYLLQLSVRTPAPTPTPRRLNRTDHSNIQPFVWSPPSAPIVIQSNSRDNDSREPYCHTSVYYEPNALPSIVPTLSLLSSCHQIRSELQSFLVYEDKKEHTEVLCILDCMLEERAISPTWILLPTSLASVHRLQINIRAFYMEKNNSSGKQELVILPRRVFELLHRLFNHGPHFYFRKSRPAPVCIDTLILNFTDEYRSQKWIIGVSPRVPVSLDRVEQVLIGLRKYGLLRGRVKTIRIQFQEYMKEIHVESAVGRARFATSSEWMAWVFRWKKDPMSHPLDI